MWREREKEKVASEYVQQNDIKLFDIVIIFIFFLLFIL